MASRYKGKLFKLKVHEMANRSNGKLMMLMQWQVDAMASL
jgi:hypothetical protein